jgi:hypothetical protein
MDAQFTRCACTFPNLEVEAEEGPSGKPKFKTVCKTCGAVWEKRGTKYIQVVAPRFDSSGQERTPSSDSEDSPAPKETGDSKPEDGEENEEDAKKEADAKKEENKGLAEKMLDAVTARIMENSDDETAKIVATVTEKVTGKKIEKPEQESGPEGSKPEDDPEPEELPPVPEPMPEPEPLNLDDFNLDIDFQPMPGNKWAAFNDVVWQEMIKARNEKSAVTSAGEGAYRIKVACEKFWVWAEKEDETKICPMRLIARVCAEARRMTEDLGWLTAKHDHEKEEDNG